MFVKLSGEKWVNAENVCSIERETRCAGEWDTRIVYVVWFTGDNKMTLNETQGNELLSVLQSHQEISDGAFALSRREGAR